MGSSLSVVAYAQHPMSPTATFVVTLKPKHRMKWSVIGCYLFI